MRSSLTRQSILVAGACLVCDVSIMMLTGVAGHREVAWLVMLVVVIVSDAALATSARWSGPVALLAIAVSLVSSMLLGGARAKVNEAGALIAAYRAGAWTRGWPAIAYLGAMFGGMTAAYALRGPSAVAPLVAPALLPSLTWLEVAIAAMTTVLPWMVGRYTTARRSYLEELRRQADQREFDARTQVERAVAEDRSAIARDLHDVISHHVSAINMHAAAARLSLGTAPQQTSRSLYAVESASRAALADLRHLLALLHGEQPDGTRQPGLSNLDDLFTGVQATLEMRGPAVALPESLDVALYRIAQEMLTNALRHGDGGPIRMVVSRSPDRLELATVNGLPGTARPGGDTRHRGLAGIRDRAALFGGSVTSGPADGGRAWRTAVVFDDPGKDDR